MDIVYNLSYNAGGMIGSFKYGNNLVENRGYDSNRLQLTSLTVGTTTQLGSVMNYSYVYADASGNNNGKLQQALDNNDATKTQVFGYDSLNRLNLFKLGPVGSPTTTLSFAYDPYGNRTAQMATGPGPTMNLAFDTNNHITTTGYGYDFNGNLTGAPGSTIYGYDKENRLLQVTVGGASQGQYSYDGLGRRISKTSMIGMQNKQSFYFNTQVGLLVEYQRPAGTTQTPSLTKEYVYMGSRVIATVASDGLTYYHTDRLGSTRKVTNGVQTVVATHDYYPFGEEIASTASNKKKFTGHYRDDESGMDYARARYLRSAIGRWLNVDPIQGRSYNPQRLNGYSYCLNDPINYIDPTGADPEPPPNGDGVPTYRQTVYGSPINLPGAGGGYSISEPQWLLGTDVGPGGSGFWDDSALRDWWLRVNYGVNTSITHAQRDEMIAKARGDKDEAIKNRIGTKKCSDFLSAMIKALDGKLDSSITKPEDLITRGLSKATLDPYGAVNAPITVRGQLSEKGFAFAYTTGNTIYLGENFFIDKSFEANIFGGDRTQTIIHEIFHLAAVSANGKSMGHEQLNEAADRAGYGNFISATAKNCGP